MWNTPIISKLNLAIYNINVSADDATNPSISEFNMSSNIYRKSIYSWRFLFKGNILYVSLKTKLFIIWNQIMKCKALVAFSTTFACLGGVNVCDRLMSIWPYFYTLHSFFNNFDVLYNGRKRLDIYGRKLKLNCAGKFWENDYVWPYKYAQNILKIMIKSKIYEVLMKCHFNKK